VAGLIAELVFRALGLIPATRHAIVPEAQIALNYTTVLNVIFLAIGGTLLMRCLAYGRSGDAADDGPPDGCLVELHNIMITTTTAPRYVTSIVA
jgi:hypothetical protein